MPSCSSIRWIAELATHDVPEERGARKERLYSLFSSQPTPRIRRRPHYGWAHGAQEALVEAIQKARLVQRTPH
jgi:hypothetical protein